MARRLLWIAVAAALFAVPAYGAAKRATLLMSGTTVRGTHFHPRERVRVKIMIASTTVRTVRTTALGTFSIAVPTFDRCSDSLVIAAVGARGDSATLKLMPRMCAPAGATP